VSRPTGPQFACCSNSDRCSNATAPPRGPRASWASQSDDCPKTRGVHYSAGSFLARLRSAVAVAPRWWGEARAGRGSARGPLGGAILTASRLVRGLSRSTVPTGSAAPLGPRASLRSNRANRRPACRTEPTVARFLILVGALGSGHPNSFSPRSSGLYTPPGVVPGSRTPPEGDQT